MRKFETVRENRRRAMTQTQIDPLAPPLVMPLDLECLDTTVLCYHVQYWQIPVIFHRESRKKTHFGPFSPFRSNPMRGS